jgi:hypothetical protein
VQEAEARTLLVTQEMLTQMREIVLDVVSTRGFSVSAALREHVMAISDIAALRRLATRAVLVASEEELLG